MREILMCADVCVMACYRMMETEGNGGVCCS